MKNRPIRRILTMLICVAVAHHGLAQSVKGKVLDESGLPLQNAYVENLHSGTHAQTGETGFFFLPGSRPGDTLSVSHVAFAPVTSVVDAGGNGITIRLMKASFQLKDVVVRSNANHLNVISSIDLKTNPVNTSQELLRKVPGLFIGQHQGGGKAEQIFLRGFDIDHGTDIAISVDGMPVNLVSHAHGQGYADLHFLIPETVEKIDFDKGPYYSNRGNLATAGYVAFATREKLDNSSVTVEAGKFNTLRTLGLFNLVNNKKQSAYLAAEYLHTDGYFQAPQNFYRLNLFGKYTAHITEKDKLAVSVSHLSSRWNASGQIPERAVEAGLITRFGSIDSTEGGNTRRTNLQLQHLHAFHAGTFLKNTVFYSRYAFELYSNFTFFLNDPVHGDQLRQKETRDLAGFESALTRQASIGPVPVSWQTAIGLRYDGVGNSELSHTLNRVAVLDSIRFGDIREANAYAFTNAEIRVGNWMINPGVRVDDFLFDYKDKLAAGEQRPVVRRAVISPKLNFIYSKSSDLQYFLKLGKGFHSNDTRVITAQTGSSILPAAYGADLGLTWKPFRNVVVNTALWYLYLQQEFIYVGDAGVVEPGGKTERKGFDAGLRWQFRQYFFFNGDFTYSFARALNSAKGDNSLPLAPRATLSGGLSYKGPAGFAGSIRTRFLGNRPANEDYSLVAKGYCVTDLNLNWSHKQFTVGIITENLFNTRWNETQFATESRLYSEPQPVTEIHFTPGTPFHIRGTVTVRF